MKYFSCYCLGLFGLLPALQAQSIQSGAARAPTNFSDQIPLDEDIGALLESPSLQIRPSGGSASLTSFSIRGSQSRELGVDLEGIPFNSPALGVFDFGLLSGFGLHEAQVIRGGYSPLSSEPSGHIHFELPREGRFRSLIGGGDFESFIVGQEIPFAQISYDRSENSYRENSSHQRVNSRAWIRKENWQLWGQFLFTDLEAPGPTDFPSRSLIQTYRPTLAFQTKWKKLELQTHLDLQRQDVESPFGNTTNDWLSSGLRASKRFEWSDKVSNEVSVDQKFDVLESDYFEAPLRSTTALSSAWFWLYSENQLLHPYLRGEIVSDMDQKFSLHPGMGGRHGFGDFQVLWNFSYILRAPSFADLYFEIPGQYLSNPGLSREESLQADLGYEFQGQRLQLRQALFAANKKNLLEIVTENNLSQTRNQSGALAYGLETSLSAQPHSHFGIETQYTIQNTFVFTERRSLFDFDLPSQRRDQFYQPVHRWRIEPQLFPDAIVQLSFPLQMRSSALANSSGERVPEQWDLGLRFKARETKLFPAEFQLKVQNLLARQRIETLGYPLQDSTYVFASISKHW